MDKSFNAEEAREHLKQRENAKNEALEKERLAILEKTILLLKEKFSHTNTEVILVGSVTRPYQFRRNSDVDIVLKNFKGDRFDLWTELEGKLERDVEVILYENCNFKDYIDKEGVRVL